MSMLSHIRKLLLCLAACLVIAAVPAMAEDDDDGRLDDAWEDAIGDQEPVLTDKQFALLNNLAFQAAAAKVCDGFTLDPDKFAAGIAVATSPAPANLSDEDAEPGKPPCSSASARPMACFWPKAMTRTTNSARTRRS